MNDQELAQRIALEIEAINGRAYYVGGCVRDSLLKRPFYDLDIIVFNVEKEDLLSILRQYADIDMSGQGFGVFSMHGHNIDVSLPRTETKVGDHYNDFKVEVNQNMDIKLANIRRDFKMNAIMMDIITNQIIDPFDGQEDLRCHLISHIDDKRFIEDPLRVIRASRFRSQLSFDISKDTLILCEGMPLDKLPKSKLKKELDKVLLSNHPEFFFETLYAINHLNDLFECEVNISKIIRKANEVKGFSKDGLLFMYTVLFEYSTLNPNYQDIISPKTLKAIIHQRQLITTSLNNLSVHNIVLSLINSHHPIDILLILKLKGIKNDLILKSYETYLSYLHKPKISGDDLIAWGISDGKIVSQLLNQAKELLIDYEYDEVLKMMEETCINLKM